MFEKQIVKIGKLKENPDNPRYIRDEKYVQLVKSIKDFPEMLNLRPIVVNEQMIILGGNMRFKALKEAGIKEVPIIFASGLSEEKQREFTIKDNLNFGEFDWSNLANNWGESLLTEWGLDIPGFDLDTGDESGGMGMESKNFTIKCDSLEQLESIQTKLSTSKTKLNYDEFITKIAMR